MESYWDLYVAYVNKCVADNWANDIDPAHYEMEWNHFLPQCIFGDWPIGHWLMKRQHAIASALQTLAFKKNCMFGWHKQYLPQILLDMCWPLYCRASRDTGQKQATRLAERNKREKWAKKVSKTEQHKSKISQALTGKEKSPTHCENISKSKKGIPNPKLQGRTLSPETRRKISEARRGKEVPSRQGRKMSEETKRKISESQKCRLALLKQK